MRLSSSAIAVIETADFADLEISLKVFSEVFSEIFLEILVGIAILGELCVEVLYL